MAATKKQKKSGSPPKARGKKGNLKKIPTKLSKVADYLAAQSASAVGAKVATEANNLKAARDTYVGAAANHVTARAAANKAESDTLAAEVVLDQSITKYVTAGDEAAAGDPAVLAGLGIDAAAIRAAQASGPAAAPTTLSIQEGAVSGESKFKWGPRPAGAAAFVAQYKLEAQPPGTPAGTPPPDWQPADGFHTKKIEWIIDGLPPAAAIRGRVRAIGDEIGPWSFEVLGKAR